MIRMDVFRLAEKLAETSGIFPDAVYAWLMETGREKGVNPKKLDICAADGVVWLAGEPDEYRLEHFPHPAHAINRTNAEADYWENRILARQELGMD